MLEPLLLAVCLPTQPAQELEYQRPPIVLGADAPRLGEWIEDLEFTALDGSSARLSQVAGERGLVIALRDVECPLSKRYSPRLVELEAELAARGFGLVYLGVQAREACARDVESHGLGARYAVDADGHIAARLAAETTTEVFVLDAARTLVYRGMIDDQYGLGFARPEPEREYLLEALDAVAAGERVRAGATQAQGCLLEVEASTERPPLTWHERVGRVVANRCEGCHRDGGVAPFALSTPEQVAKRGRMIAFAVEEGRMPPWFAEEGSGPWANHLGLTALEKDDLLAWLKDGAPAGDAANAALPRAYTDGWTIGEPDLVVPMPEAFTVPADGVVDYQTFHARIDLPEDRWIKAVEIRPGAKQVVHHVLVFLEDPELQRRAERGDREAARALQGGEDGFFAGTVPGQLGITYPAGTGKLLPAKTWLKFQLHYTPNGSEVVDRSEVGFVFAEPGEELVEIRTTSALSRNFEIPPGAFDFEVSGDYVFPEDAAIQSLFPHTHLRGMRFLFALVGADGTSEDLLPLPEYDFNWQLAYDLATPRRVRAGTILRATAWYDNTDGNPNNPDPTRAVGFGEQTSDEMMIGYVNWVPTRPRPVEAAASR
jgi:hypothetical protein